MTEYQSIKYKVIYIAHEQQLSNNRSIVARQGSFRHENTVVIVKIFDSMNHELPTNARVGAMKTNLYVRPWLESHA
jgi:hypothetical protein